MFYIKVNNGCNMFYNYYCLVKKVVKKEWFSQVFIAQSVGAVEYTDCTSAEG